ncbi:RuvC-like resolvase [Gordonia phage Pleakley]|uniref:RuvC-like resolvase n=1 Tax=Gordonia phage Pleakley TaxID=2283246 RepID=A0A345M6I3_9CAUD|nr:RuvC-like resolvase [Gordonia phage Pleakley]AXH49791.1 RuvC-like resolvase [Gordonia phage Fury]AXH66104.1 RuvC-like resolvase [Gordonia phage Pleakley]
MKARDTPKTWLDRKQAFGENPEYPDPLVDRVAALSDDRLKALLSRGVSVVAFDPGGTTGWSIMRLDIERLFDKKTRPHEMITQWWHGEIDCGAMSGNAGSSALAQGYDLGESETGEAAGVFLCERLIHLGGGIPRSAVVIEDFILRTQTQARDALSPVRITAALQQLLWEGKDVTTYKQQPSEAKTTCTDDRLKQWGFWTPGSRHARDADRHAILFVRKTREQRSKIFAAWPILAEANRRGMLGLEST